jgi:hypothetical protein
MSTLNDLGPTDPTTGTTVVLSSYQTWRAEPLSWWTWRETLSVPPVESSRTARPAADPKTLDPEAEEEEELSTPSPVGDDVRD